MIEKDEVFVSLIAAALVVLIRFLLGATGAEDVLVFFAAYTGFFLLAAALFRYRGVESRTVWVVSSAATVAAVTVIHNILRFEEVALPGDGSAGVTATNVAASFGVEFFVGAGMLAAAIVLYERSMAEYV